MFSIGEVDEGFINSWMRDPHPFLVWLEEKNFWRSFSCLFSWWVLYVKLTSLKRGKKSKSNSQDHRFLAGLRGCEEKSKII